MLGAVNDHGPRIRRHVSDSDDAHAETCPIFHNQTAPQHEQQRRRPSQPVQRHAQPLPPVIDHERGLLAPSHAGYINPSGLRLDAVDPQTPVRRVHVIQRCGLGLVWWYDAGLCVVLARLR